MLSLRFLRGLTALLATAALAFAPACDSSNDEKDGGDSSASTTLTVTPSTLTLEAAAGSSAEISITSQAAWSATSTGEGFTFAPSEGTGNATLHVSATTANNDSEAKQLGQITISIPGSEATVAVSQEGATPEPLPITEVLTLDFARGPEIATPALPASTEEALSGRHEYTIDGRPFAIFADGDPEINGKFFWNDQTRYYEAPEPNKALFFSKEGAYVEFPAVDGKVLSTIEYVYMNGAGQTPEFDIQTTDGESADHSLVYADDDTAMTFTLLMPTLNTSYRLTIINGKNAQVARLVLTYMVPKL